MPLWLDATLQRPHVENVRRGRAEAEFFSRFLEGAVTSLDHLQQENSSSDKRHGVAVVDSNRLSRAALARALTEAHYEIRAESSAIEDLDHELLSKRRSLLLIVRVTAKSIDKSLAELRDLRASHKGLVAAVLYDECVGSRLAEILGKKELIVEALLPSETFDAGTLLKALDLILVGQVVTPKSLLPSQGAAPVAVVNYARPEKSPEGIPTRLSTTVSCEEITPREMMVWSQISKGFSNKCIARELGIAESTVKIHVRNLMLKLEVQNRTQLAAVALRPASKFIDGP